MGTRRGRVNTGTPPKVKHGKDSATLNCHE